MPRPIQAIIDIQAMAHNLGVLATACPTAAIWAIAKANAYGHGIEAAVEGFSNAQGLALLDFAEARRARAAGWNKPILMLEGAFDSEDLELAKNLDLQLVVHDQVGLDAIESSEGNLPAIWLKFNSGMNRLGFSASNRADDQKKCKLAIEQAVQLRQQGRVSKVCAMTHFADADGTGGITNAMVRWNAIVPLLNQANISITSLANSATSLRYAGAGSTWVRAGIALYGASAFAPDLPTAADLGLRPAMGLYSKIIAVRELHVGESIGYGQQFTADKPMRVGVVACGYADGYPRIARSGTPILVSGQRTKIVGRVSMDMIVVDLTDLRDLALTEIGSHVELWGRNLPIDEVAAGAQTIGYELMCGLAARVPVVHSALLK